MLYLETTTDSSGDICKQRDNSHFCSALVILRFPELKARYLIVQIHASNAPQIRRKFNNMKAEAFFSYDGADAILVLVTK